MLKNRKKLISLILLVVLVFTIAFLLRGNTFKNSSKELINVNKLSKRYMDNYFSEIKKLNKENLDYTLIVISKKRIKDGYGAKKIVNAPNNQYYLIYDDEIKMNNAKNKLKKEKGIISVDKNHKYKLFDDKKSLDKDKENITKAGMNYSWGYSKMALNERVADDVNFEDVTVAVIDSGIDLELFNKYFDNRIEETFNVYDDKEMSDSDGHGTHVAGIIADGTAGTNVKILPVKQTDGHFIDEIHSIAAVNWINYNSKADVINMSFGSAEYSEAFFQALEAAYYEDIISVAAAGNYNNSIPCYPAAFDHTISVGSVDENLERSSFSNYGDSLDFVAPGSNIKSVMGVNTNIAQENIRKGLDDHDSDFETINGTSMAAPHMASVVAVFKSMNKAISLDETISLLEKYAIDLGEDGADPYYGSGFVNFSVATLCGEDDECDDAGVFVENDAPRIFGVEPVSETYESLYNYGNETNLLSAQFKIYYNEDDYIVKELGEMSNYRISNYDPYTEGIQNVRIKYQGTIDLRVNNHTTDGYTYEEEGNDTIRLTGLKTSQEYPKYFIVPEEYHDKEIVSMSSEVFRTTDVKKVKILSAIDTIEASSFANCDKLSSVELPNSIETIEADAFYDTSSLTSIDLLYGITEIGIGAFSNSGLINIVIPSSVRVVPTEAFAECSSLTSVEIEDGVTEIQADAFKHASNLKKIYIPESVTNIDYGAFGGTYNMTDIDLDERNTMYKSEYGSGTIVDLTANKLLYANGSSEIPDTIQTIGPYAISAALMIIPDSITALDNNALYYAGEVVYPRSVSNAESAAAFAREEQWGGYNYVYAQSFVHNYMGQNEVSYLIIDSERPLVSMNNKVYDAFGKVDLSNENFGIATEYDTGSGTYARPHTKITGDKNYEISYQHDTDYFRGDDEYFTVSFDSEITGIHYDERVNVTVNKLTPEYTAPTNLTGGLGSKLSTVKLPSGFEWMDGTQKMTKVGNNTYKAKFIPEDVINYETVENIDVIVRVINNKTVITPTIVLTNKTYDGTSNIPMENIRITNLEEDDYTIVSATASKASVGQTTATIRLKLSDTKFERYSFEDGKQEEDYVVYFEILKAEINVTDTTEDKTVDYDGNQHSITVHADYPSNATLRYMDSNGEYSLTNPPKYTEAGIYVIKYRISIDENYESYYGEKTLIIDDGSTFEINKYTVDEDDHLIGKIMVGTTESTFTSNITLGRNYSVEVDYKVVNNKHLLYTGGKTKIYKNSNLIVEYTNVVVGDVSGDAKVNSADILLMRQHMLGINTLSGAKYSAANINYDNNVNSADLLRIRQHLLDILPIS